MSRRRAFSARLARSIDLVAQRLDLVRRAAEPAERLRVLGDFVLELLGPLGRDATGDLVPPHRRSAVIGDRVLEPLLRAGIEHRVEPAQLELEVARRVDLRERFRRGLLGDAHSALREEERDRDRGQCGDDRKGGEQWERARGSRSQ